MKQVTGRALGGAYRAACEELTRLRNENAEYKARLHSVCVLCEAPVP